MRRRGFTLIEMLVATVVFAIGFVGVFGLFLAGMRFRKQSEDLTRCSLAASSLVSEFAIDAGRESAAPMEPGTYLGDGFADRPSPADPTTDPDHPEKAILVPYRAQPGVFYRVESCTDLLGADTGTNSLGEQAASTTVLRMRLLVVPWATVDQTASLVDIAKRLQLRSPIDNSPLWATPASPDAIATELVRRGLALRSDAVITRRPSWMP